MYGIKLISLNSQIFTEFQRLQPSFKLQDQLLLSMATHHILETTAPKKKPVFLQLILQQLELESDQATKTGEFLSLNECY